jgi:molybdopterin-guanine dinucleotide biosynthesis protein A
MGRAVTLGVLVAGGRGARLGAGTPKALVRLGGATLLERARRVLGAVCDATVVTAPPELAPRLGAGVTPDAPGGGGPLAGIVAGLSRRRFERAIVLGVDFPWLGPEMLRALAARLDAAPAVLPAPGGVPQPLASVLSARAAPALAAAFDAGERSAAAAIVALGPVVLDDAALERLPGGVAAFFNLNTRADLERAAARCSREAGA